MNSVDDIKTLGRVAAPEYMLLCESVLGNPLFGAAPASSGHHPGPHQEEGGLALHTLEVANIAVELAAPNGALMEQAYIAAVFHDYGKIYEYAFADGKATSLPFRNRTGHIPYSWAFFREKSQGVLTESVREEIGHAILAHHGRKEWGSPVEPQTRLAYILHAADMMSSRGVR